MAYREDICAYALVGRRRVRLCDEVRDAAGGGLLALKCPIESADQAIACEVQVLNKFKLEGTDELRKVVPAIKDAYKGVHTGSGALIRECLVFGHVGIPLNIFATDLEAIHTTGLPGEGPKVIDFFEIAESIRESTDPKAAHLAPYAALVEQKHVLALKVWQAGILALEGACQVRNPPWRRPVTQPSHPRNRC
jgi:hypothetical protein